MTWVLSRVLFSLLLLAVGWKVFCQVAALQISLSTPGIEGAQAAIRWDSDGPAYYFQLGLIYRDDLKYWDLVASRTNLERAVGLNPYNWQYWLELGRSYEISSLPQEAEQAYLKAVELNPRFAAYRWRLGNFYVRNQQIKKSIPQIQAALSLDPSYQEAALDLFSRIGLEREEIEHLWPEDRASRLVLVKFLLQKARRKGSEEGLDSFIEKQWEKLLSGSYPMTVPEGDGYVRHLHQKGLYGQARTRWLQLATVNGLRDRNFEAESNLIWNGEFENPMTRGSLDWRLSSGPGFLIIHTQDEGFDRTRCLRIDFQGTENLKFRNLVQKVIVEPNTTYDFSVQVRSQEISTEQGIFLEIMDDRTGSQLLRTKPILGTIPWSRYHGSFSVPAGSHLLTVRSRRKRSRRIDNSLRGTLWLDSISLRATSSQRSDQRKVTNEEVSRL